MMLFIQIIELYLYNKIKQIEIMTLTELKEKREIIIAQINERLDSCKYGHTTSLKECMEIYAKWALKGKSAPLQYVDAHMKKSTNKCPLNVYFADNKQALNYLKNR